MLECVVNISEGRSPETIAAIARAAGPDLLDVHSDPHHHRSVLTLVGEDAPRKVAAAAIELLDLTGHDGVHPRIGVLDVVPFVALGDAADSDAQAARDGFGAWLADTLRVPGFAYGPERTLPDVRRQAWSELTPTWGPHAPHPTAGATAVGVRPLMVAYNLWAADSVDLAKARAVARAVRSAEVRALGLQVGDRVQVSFNLIQPHVVGPAQVWDRVAEHLPLAGAELVGLVPQAVLHSTPDDRWAQLDLSADRTIEGRVRAAREV